MAGAGNSQLVQQVSLRGTWRVRCLRGTDLLSSGIPDTSTSSSSFSQEPPGGPSRYSRRTPALRIRPRGTWRCLGETIPVTGRVGTMGRRSDFPAPWGRTWSLGPQRPGGESSWTARLAGNLREQGHRGGLLLLGPAGGNHSLAIVVKGRQSASGPAGAKNLKSAWRP